MPRPKSAPRSMSQREEKLRQASTLRSGSRRRTPSSSSEEEEEESASQQHRRRSSSISSQSSNSTVSGAARRSQSAGPSGQTTKTSEPQTGSRRTNETPRASRSRSRRDASSSSSDEEEEDASGRNRRSRSSGPSSPSSHTTRPSTSGSQRRSLSAGPSPQASTSRPQTRRKRGPRMAPMMREMLKLQLSWNLLIPKASFGRLVRELFDNRFRITPTALEALHEATEMYIVHLFEDAYKCCLHRARVTLAPKDIELVIYLRRAMR